MKQLVRPHGFTCLGLQFALDYAYFLNRTKRLPVPLLEPMREIIEAHMNNREESEHARALARELRKKLDESP